ncbi:BRCT domain-containing protein [Lasiodiplodia theobromae]|uniref:BRCT domain-containing protein n=1 Tax=Lasiodiplodia theobromae TaxID=45133 RepID=A0A8H7IPU8_9PEZI|nr:BRCT domain-containing protein [Lasiodiplodia theobromae]
MVATRAQRAQTKDEPAAPKRNALAAPARRGKKPEGDKPGSTAQKPTRAAATAKRAAAKPAAPTAAKQPAPTTRRTRAKEAEAPAPKITLEDPEPADELEVVEEPVAPAPAKATRKTAAKVAPKQTATTTTTTTTASRKRSAREIEPEPARPAKRQTRSRVTEDPQEREQDESMEAAESKKAVAAPRATRATRGTKASQSRSAATVKPLAQRITVTAKKPTRKAKAEVPEPAVVEVEMEDADEEEAQAPEPAKSTRKSSRRAASEEPQEPASDAPVEPTPAKSTRKSSRRKTLEEVPEVPAEAAETEDQEDPAPVTPVKSTKKVSEKPAEEEEAEKLDEEPVVEEQEPASTPVRTPEAPQQPETPVKPTPAPPKSILKSVRPEAKENVPPKTPGPAHYAATFPFAQEATPFFRPEIAPQAASFQARTPGFTKSLLHETPRKAPIASPFKLPPMSAAKHVAEANTGSILNSPAKRAPLGAPMHGMTPMRPTAAKPEIKASLLQTPAKKGLMLPPSTAPVNKQGPQPAHAKSSLLQTCPRKIALPGLPPKSSMTSPTKADEGAMGSSLLSATPRKVRIEPPTQPAFGTSVQDFAIQAQNSALAVEPRRWNTPARTPAKRFATPGKTPAKSLVDADAGSPTPVKRTPAGVKDVNSALKLLNEASSSPAMPPATPTEQFVQTVIDKIDQSMSESESSEAAYSSQLSQDIEVARSADDEQLASDDYHHHNDIAADLDLGQRPADAGEVDPCVSPADLVMSDSETPLGSPRAVPVEDVVMVEQVDVSMQDFVGPVQEVVVEDAAAEALQDVPEIVEPIAEEPSAVAHHEEYVEATPARSEIQFIEDVHEVEAEPEPEHQPEIEPVEAAPEAVQMAVEQVEQHVQEVVEERFEEHVEQSTEQPIEKPAEQPIEQLVEEYVEVQVEPQVEPQVEYVEEYVEEKVEETTIVEQTTSVQEEIVEEIPVVTTPQIPERPSTPTMEEQHAAALAKEKAKTERRDRRKRLSMAIELESSVRKPRKSLAFIPSLTPAKSALRSPFKKPFGSPKKSVAWATEPTQARIIEEPQQPQTPKVVHHTADTDVNIPRPDDGLLNGTVFFVDVRTVDGEDAGDLFIPLLEEMGAKIVNDWNSNISHVLFKDGDSETLEKVFATNGAVKAVNIGWVLDCERFNKWVAEDEYLIEVSRLLDGSPARNLFAPSVANTPARATPAKSAFGTPFALMSLTPKGKPTLSPFADITTPKPSTPIADAEDKENTPPTQLFKTPTKPSTPAVTVAGAAGEFSPSTPYYLHPENIIQKTCPPKQINKGLFDRDERQATAVTPFRQKMLLARRSLSPAAFGRAQGF